MDGRKLESDCELRTGSGAGQIWPIFGPYLTRGDQRLRDDGDYMALAMLAQAEESGHAWVRPSLDWVIVGGESGPDARPFDPQWARSIRDNCRAAGVPFFMKQMSGARKSLMPPIPDDLMIREYPDVPGL